MKLFSVFLLSALLLAFNPCIIAQEKPATYNWEVYFSPHGGCADAIIRELNKTKSTILVQAYSFTSAPIAKALLNAHQRGVKVEVILDPKQEPEDRSIFFSHVSS